MCGDRVRSLIWIRAKMKMEQINNEAGTVVETNEVGRWGGHAGPRMREPGKVV